MNLVNHIISTRSSSGATDVARMLGLSEAVIGITIVSAGSSLPELAVSVNAARKGNAGIALGNVLGSNILNIFFLRFEMTRHKDFITNNLFGITTIVFCK